MLYLYGCQSGSIFFSCLLSGGFFSRTYGKESGKGFSALYVKNFNHQWRTFRQSLIKELLTFEKTKGQSQNERMLSTFRHMHILSSSSSVTGLVGRPDFPRWSTLDSINIHCAVNDWRKQRNIISLMKVRKTIKDITTRQRCY